MLADQVRTFQHGDGHSGARARHEISLNFLGIVSVHLLKVLFLGVDECRNEITSPLKVHFDVIGAFSKT